MNPLNPMKILFVTGTAVAVLTFWAIVRFSGPRQAVGERPAQPIPRQEATDASMPLHPVATIGQFRRRVTESRQPTLVAFTATWCPYCRQLAPVLEGLARDYQGRVEFLEVNIDALPDIARAYEVKGVPTVLLMDRGNVQVTLTGNRPAGDFRDAIDPLLQARR